MKNFKKFLTLVLAVMMVVSSVAFSTSAATTKFEDVDAKNEALVKAVDLLNYVGVAKGTSETTFGADELVTRQQFALFVYRLMKGGKDAPAGAANTTKFTDLEDPTYNYAIAWANAQGIVNGKSETTFAPKDGIKLQEAYAMLVRALKWEEEETLTYPFDHIEIAEQDGVELDENLDSTVGYSDVLTRGDMAILLYNTFFAEIGIEEIETKFSVNTTTGEVIYVEEADRNKLCEEAFGVIETVYEAVATPNYSKASYDPTYDLGFDAIYFVEDESDGRTTVVNEAYLTAEEIGLEADELNDYFLGKFTLFVTEDEDNKIEKVLFADCNMTKKTVTDIKLAEVSTNKVTSYFDSSVTNGYTDAKVLSGKLIADGEEIYVYNAPYTYAEPTYPTALTDAYSQAGLTKADMQYDLRNADNATLISFALNTAVTSEDCFTPVFTTIADNSALDGDVTAANDFAPATGSTAVPFQAQAIQLIEKMPLAYYDGLYEADLYDVDGDGIYDYIDYKPYSVFVVDTDEDEDFSLDSTFTATGTLDIPYIYTEGATVEGVEFADEDVVLGYFSTALDYVKVVEVLKPTSAAVANLDASRGALILDNGDTVDYASYWRMVNNYIDTTDVSVDGNLAGLTIEFDFVGKNESIVYNSSVNNGFFAAGTLDLADEYDFYVKDGVVLCSSPVDAWSKYTENLIIPTTLGGTKNVREGFNKDTGDVTHYVYAFVDGETKYVEVEYDEDMDTTGPVNSNLVLNSNYEDKICTYTVSSNGLYTIIPLGEDVYDDYGSPVYEAVNSNASDLDDADEDYQYYFEDNIDTYTLEKVAGTRFYLKDSTGTNVLNTITGTNRTVELKSYTKIIIQDTDTYNNNKISYHEYDATTFTKSVDNGVNLTNVSLVLSNNPDSKSKENLVLLYAETQDFAFKGTADKNGWRIVSLNLNLDQNEDGEWYRLYNLYDPFTGTKTTNVASVNTATKANNLPTAVAIGDIINLEDGMVDETEGIEGVVTNENNLVWIADVDTDEDFIMVVPYDSTVEDVASTPDDDDVELYVDGAGDPSAYPVYDIEGNVIKNNGSGTNANYIGVDKDTVISVVSYSSAFTSGDFWKAASIKLTDLDTIAAKKKEVLAYNADCVDKNGNKVTKYSDYVKAFVSVDMNVDADEYPVAEFIIVVVNGGEIAAEDKIDNP